MEEEEAKEEEESWRSGCSQCREMSPARAKQQQQQQQQQQHNHAGHSGHWPRVGDRTFYCSLRVANKDNVQKGEIGLCGNEKYIFLYKGIFSNTRK